MVTDETILASTSPKSAISRSGGHGRGGRGTRLQKKTLAPLQRSKTITSPTLMSSPSFASEQPSEAAAPPALDEMSAVDLFQEVMRYHTEIVLGSPKAGVSSAVIIHGEGEADARAEAIAVKPEVNAAAEDHSSREESATAAVDVENP